MRPRRGAGSGAAILALWLTAAMGGSAPGATTSDYDAPVILVLPHTHGSEADSIVLRARVEDPSGVGGVTARRVAADGTSGEALEMHAVGDDVFEVTISAQPGERVSYWVQATDRLGNGPRREGSPRQPFVAMSAAPLPEIAATGEVAQTAAFSGRSAVALLILAGLLGGVLLRGRRARSDLSFWREALTPIARLDGDLRAEAIRIFCSRPRFRPRRGLSTIPRAEVELWLARIGPVPPAPAHDPAAEPPDACLRDASGNRRGSRAEAAHLPVTTPAGNASNSASAGMTLVELLVVLAMLGATLVIGSVYLSAMEAPVTTATQMLDGLLRDARTRAMATTTVHRVRPVDARSFVVETAQTCSSGTWTPEPGLTLELPAGVTLTDTSWSVCFTSRGVSSSNLVLTLTHADQPDRNLEVLAGGATRLLD